MKPINAIELKRAYQLFSLNFIILLACSLICLCLFFSARNYEYHLLEQQADQSTQLLSKRKDINTQLDLILLRFNQLSKFNSITSEEMDNQVNMLEDIQNANAKIKDIIKDQQSNASSFLLYKKMTDDVEQMAGIQDSLSNTRFQIESIKAQLESCVKTSRSAENKLSNGNFGR